MNDFKAKPGSPSVEAHDCTVRASQNNLNDGELSSEGDEHCEDYEDDKEG